MADDATTRTRARGRRAKPRERSFGRTLGLTVLSAVVPGSGFVAAGRRLLGFALLTVIGIGVMLAIGVLLVEHDPTMLAAELASRPHLLVALGIALLVGAAVWAVVIIASHRMLRSPGAPSWQRGVGLALALGLCAAVLVPSVYASRSAFATASAINEIFVPAPVITDDAGEVVEIDREDPWKGRPRVNILLLGSDSGDDRTGTRTDTVIVASINTTSGDTVLFSLPRNLQDVPFPRSNPLHDVWPNGFNCGDVCLLNAVYEQAHQYEDLFPASDPDPGITTLRDVTGEILGLDVDYYALVNLQGFEDVVDALGGIDMNVGDERIPMGGTDINGNDQPEWKIEEWVEAGQQHLDGKEALWVARSRWRSDDYERMQRQRCVINAVVAEADPATVLTNYLSLVQATSGTITSSIPPQLFPAFAELAARVKTKPLRSLPFTPAVTSPAYPDFDLIRDLVEQALVPPLPPPSSAPTTTAPPATTDPGETPTPTETTTIDPTEAVSADAVC